jgi:hypothetical protein
LAEISDVESYQDHGADRSGLPSADRRAVLAEFNGIDAMAEEPPLLAQSDETDRRGRRAKIQCEEPVCDPWRRAGPTPHLMALIPCLVNCLFDERCLTRLMPVFGIDMGY